CARQAGIALTITGFGAAFSLHFTSRTELTNYRHTLEDDKELLGRFLRLALDEGLYLLPDGRFYVSTVHSEREVGDTIEAVKRVFAVL
ncbi:MAG: hypothetical protein SFV51_12085, partial [Bryobacteraceae bacterium]|nr:hypothetical protein [Bryobacteraceae bacterium]